MERNFWERVCEEFDYRLFAGIPFKEIDYLYKTMNSDIMHYVPAANSMIAVKLAAGARVSGFKSGVLLDPLKINNLDFGFNIKFEIPLLIITSVTSVPLREDLYSNSDILKVVNYIEGNKKPGVLLL